VENNWIDRRTPTFLISSATCLGAVRLCLWLAHSDSVAMLLVGPALLLTGSFGLVWLSRARTARRFAAAWDAYAERETDWERCRNQPQSLVGVSTRLAEQPAQA
jgi:hypothetical protein